MDTCVQFKAYDIANRELPFEYRLEKKEVNDAVWLKFKVRNTSSEPVYPALFQLLEFNSEQESLHVYKPGFNKPSDTARFYTPSVHQKNEYCNTWIGDCLASFPETSLLFSTMSAMQLDKEKWMLWGFTTFEAYHGVIEYSAKGDSVLAHAWLEGEQSRFESGEWVDLEEIVILKGTFVHCLDRYCNYLTALHGKRTPGAMTGWSDWEYFRVPGKSEETSVASIVDMGKLKRQGYPLDSMVVDAGWCENVYRWDTPHEKFPHGPEWLCRRITAENGLPGLWIAPWLMTHYAPVAREHPEWLALDRTTNAPRCVYRTDGQMIHTLDFSVPEAVEWFRGQLRMMLSWGYRYFKLDGPVFSHYNNTKFHDPHSTRYRQINDIMRMIREELGDEIFIESEGVYGPAIGIADFHRITQDEHPRWYNPNGAPILAINVPTTLCGAYWNNRFWSNTNMIVLRDAPTPNLEFYPEHPELRETLLTDNELHAYITSMWFTCSSLYFSAPFSLTMRSPYYAEHFRRVLPAGHDLLTEPIDVEKDYPTVFRSTCTGRSFLHVYNFDETYRNEMTVDLPGEFHVYDYWAEQYLGKFSGHMTVRDLPPRSCRLFWLTPADEDVTLVGATAHIAGIGISLKKQEDNCYLLSVPTFAQTEQKVTLAIENGVSVVPIDANFVLCDARLPGVVTLSFVAKDQPILLKKRC